MDVDGKKGEQRKRKKRNAGKLRGERERSKLLGKGRVEARLLRKGGESGKGKQGWSEQIKERARHQES